MGGVSALFIKSIYGTESFFERRIRGSYYRQHVIGMLGVGLIIYGLMASQGHYFVAGVGYATVQEVLSGAPYSLALLLVLFGAKLVATSLTLGSGASGGIFSPALFLGATAGGAYGLILGELFPRLDISAPAFAVAGMAGVVGGATGAAMAAIVMIFEMTLDYNVIVPMTITVAISYGIRKVLSRESIYTMKLVRRGHYIPEALRTNPHFVRRAGEMMLAPPRVVDASSSLEAFARVVAERPAAGTYLVCDDGRVLGVVRTGIALEALQPERAQVKLRELVDDRFITVHERSTLFDVMTSMRSHGAAVALVTDGSGPLRVEEVQGTIAREQLADAMVEAADLYLD